MENGKRIYPFNVLLQFNLEDNLDNWFRNYARIVKGRIESKPGEPLIEEGGEENEKLKGILVLENGDTLVSRLKEDRIVLDTIIPPAVYVDGESGLLDYIRKAVKGENSSRKKSRESSYALDGKHNRVTRVREFSNNIDSLDGILFKDYVPTDFISTQEYIDPDEPEGGIGTKTRNAIRLALGYPNVRTFQIKRTPYSNTGMGVVTEFGKDGLVRTVHLEYMPGKKSPNIPYVPVPPGFERFQLVAIDRRYKRDDRNERGIVCASKNYLDVREVLPLSVDRDYINA